MSLIARQSKFDGRTLDPQRDDKRLTTQSERVFEIVKDGEWHTISEIAAKVNGSEAAISARLRDFRKAKFGAFQVEREYVERGLFRYRLLAPKPPDQLAFTLE